MPEFIFYVFFARCSFSSYFCIGVFSHFFQVMIFQVLCFIFAVYLALLLFVFIRSLRSCGIAASSCRQHLQLQTMRHCRSGIAASIYSGIAASIYSGIAANMHSQRHCRKAALPPTCIHTAALPPVCSGTAAMQRALTAALPPACVHSGSAASMHSLRHCRQQALTCSGIAAILSSVRGSAAPSELMLQFRLISVCLVWGSISGHPFLFGATWLASSSSAT